MWFCDFSGKIEHCCLYTTINYKGRSQIFFFKLSLLKLNDWQFNKRVVKLLAHVSSLLISFHYQAPSFLTGIAFLFYDRDLPVWESSQCPFQLLLLSHAAAFPGSFLVLSFLSWPVFVQDSSFFFRFPSRVLLLFSQTHCHPRHQLHQ